MVIRIAIANSDVTFSNNYKESLLNT